MVKRLMLVAGLAMAATGAQAKGHHHRSHYAHRHSHVIASNFNSGRPSDCFGIPWCGCWLRHVMGIADKALNLAANWAHYGRATSPHVGAVVVWPHHVGRIVGRSGGEWVVNSGNDGHRVRTRPRSLAGAIAFREI